MTNELTKRRIQQERAKREWDAAKKAEYEARMKWEKLWFAYLDEAERNGLCRCCLKPRNEGLHEHILIAESELCLPRGWVIL